ncbi:MAG: hypothetical protein IJW90_04575, partial [Clostridia bacterium]|nr:hypothetical protein [Clostridia bacterium]
CGLPPKRLLTHKGFVDVGTTGDHIGSPLRVFVNSPLNNNLHDQPLVGRPTIYRNVFHLENKEKYIKT